MPFNFSLPTPTQLIPYHPTTSTITPERAPSLEILAVTPMPFLGAAVFVASFLLILSPLA